MSNEGVPIIQALPSVHHAPGYAGIFVRVKKMIRMALPDFRIEEAKKRLLV